MVITVQGYNGKNNKAVQTISAIAGMSAITAGEKTLVIQLINNDIDTVEDNLLKVEKAKFGGDEQTSFADEGIDSIMRVISTSKLNKGDFNQMCTPLLMAENRLDICGVSKSDRFTSMVLTKINDIEDLIADAKEVYQNIFILVPIKNEDVAKTINALKAVDVSVYCLKQGHTTKGNVYGKHIVYVVTEYEEESVFSLRSMKEIYSKKKEPIYKISRNVHVTDAALKGRLLYFIKKNAETDGADINHIWSEDVKKVTDAILNTKHAVTEDDELPKEKRPFLKRVLGGAPDNVDGEDKNLAMYEEDEPTDADGATLADKISAVASTMNSESETVSSKKEKRKGFSLFGRKKKYKEEDAPVELTEEEDDYEDADAIDDYDVDSYEDDDMDYMEEEDDEEEDYVEEEVVEVKPVKKTASRTKTSKKAAVNTKDEAVEEAEEEVKEPPKKIATRKATTKSSTAKAASTKTTAAKTGTKKSTASKTKADDVDEAPKKAPVKKTTSKAASKTADKAEVVEVVEVVEEEKATAVKKTAAKASTKRTTSTKTTATKTTTTKTTAAKTKSTKAKSEDN